MASIQDMLSSLLSAAGNHEELLGAIPAIAGAALLARNGQVGGPLGAGLATAGGLLSLNAANRPQKQLLVNKNTGQLEPWDTSQPLGKDLETQSMYEEAQKLTQQKPGKFNPIQITGPHGNTVYGRENEATGEERWDPLGVKPYEKPTAPKEPKDTTGVEMEAAKNLGLPLDPNKWTPEQSRAHSTEVTRLNKDRRPVTNVNVETPVSPADILPALPGSKAPGSVLMKSRSGALTGVPSPIGPVAKASGAATIHNEDFGGYKYGFKYAKGDPSYGIGRFNDKEPGMFHHKPAKGVVWKIGGRIVNPEALTPKQREKAAAQLKAKGFTIDEITGNPLG